jgi:hypothetical protein
VLELNFASEVFSGFYFTITKRCNRFVSIAYLYTITKDWLFYRIKGSEIISIVII